MCLGDRGADDAKFHPCTAVCSEGNHRDEPRHGPGRIRFTSAILPRWARRTRSLDALLPTLYLRGISTGDVQEALSALLGKDAPNLSPSVVGRLTAAWQAEYDRWQERDLSARRYVYVWADGVYLQARMEEKAECWSSLEPRRKAGRNWSGLGSVCGKAPRAGGSCWST